MENNGQATAIPSASSIPRKSRKKIIAVTIIVLLIISGFLVFKYIQSARFDQKRLSDIDTLKVTIEKYYKDYKILPVSIAAFSHIYTTTDPIDPETKKDYVYRKISPTEYKLCTKFSTNSQEALKKVKKDKEKGLGCITYRVALNIDTANLNLLLNPATPSRAVFRIKEGGK